MTDVRSLRVVGSSDYGSSTTPPCMTTPPSYGTIHGETKEDAKHITSYHRRRFHSQLSLRRLWHRAVFRAPHLTDLHLRVVPANGMKDTDYMSLDFDENESILWYDSIRSRNPLTWSWNTAFRWIACLLIGVLTALVAFFIDFSVDFISGWKFYFLQEAMTGFNFKWGWIEGVFFGFLFWAGSNALLCLIATVLVAYVEPVAIGSGIPDIKCLLNGVHIPRATRFRTMCVKVFGVLCAVAGGLQIGKEGPMIHSGAVVGNGVSQNICPAYKFKSPKGNAFRNDLERRDFLAVGSAAGVAAAFGAPIGGVLFSLEEGASYWNVSLTWRSLFSTVSAVFTLYFLLTISSREFWVDRTSYSFLSNPKLVNFGLFEDSEVILNYRMWEVPLFLLLGALGGVGGALFNSINSQLAIARRRWIHYTGHSKVVEVLLVSLLTSTVAYMMPIVVGSCVKGSQERVESLHCPPGYLNDYAALSLNTQEGAVSTLLHSSAGFTPTTLITFGVAYWMVSVITYGIAVPSGLFVPVMVSGAAFGRLMGEILADVVQMIPGMKISSPGVYALIGASAMLGGVTRMTISITVIIIEATNAIGLLLPIVLAIMISKFVGDVFNSSLYDMHIQIRGVPFLEWFATKDMELLRAQDIMAKHKIVVLEKQEKVGVLLSVLQSCEHGGFPVVSGDENAHRSFEGLLLRSDIIIFLTEMMKKAESGLLYHPDQLARFLHTDMHEHITLEDLRSYYPRVPDIKNLQFEDRIMHMVCDLSPMINVSPFVVEPQYSASRCYRLFRTMGLRHLVVIDSDHEVCGILTRKDLTPEACHEAAQRLREN
jgi:chloride channel 7